jgi:hypothetical protein
MFTLRQYQDRLPPAAVARPDLEAQHGLVYVYKGSATVNGRLLEEDTGGYYRDVATVEAGPAGAVVWRWELVRTEAANNLAEGDGVVSHLRMSRRIRMLELVPTSKWVFRLDCVSNHQGSTGLHSHPGSGIRCLREGHLRVESAVGECSDNRLPGDVWYEEGSYPVNATADPGETAAFVRGMVLPPEYARFPAMGSWIEGQEPTKTTEWKCYVLEVVTLL